MYPVFFKSHCLVDDDIRRLFHSNGTSFDNIRCHSQHLYDDGTAVLWLSKDYLNELNIHVFEVDNWRYLYEMVTLDEDKGTIIWRGKRTYFYQLHGHGIIKELHPDAVLDCGHHKLYDSIQFCYTDGDVNYIFVHFPEFNDVCPKLKLS